MGSWVSRRMGWRWHGAGLLGEMLAGENGQGRGWSIHFPAKLCMVVITVKRPPWGAFPPAAGIWAPGLMLGPWVQGGSETTHSSLTFSLHS